MISVESNSWNTVDTAEELNNWDFQVPSEAESRGGRVGTYRVPEEIGQRGGRVGAEPTPPFPSYQSPVSPELASGALKRGWNNTDQFENANERENITVSGDPEIRAAESSVVSPPSVGTDFAMDMGVETSFQIHQSRPKGRGRGLSNLLKRHMSPKPGRIEPEKQGTGLTASSVTLTDETEKRTGAMGRGKKYLSWNEAQKREWDSLSWSEADKREWDNFRTRMGITIGRGIGHSTTGQGLVELRQPGSSSSGGRGEELEGAVGGYLSPDRPRRKKKANEPLQRNPGVVETSRRVYSRADFLNNPMRDVILTQRMEPESFRMPSVNVGEGGTALLSNGNGERILNQSATVAASTARSRTVAHRLRAEAPPFFPEQFRNGNFGESWRYGYSRFH